MNKDLPPNVNALIARATELLSPSKILLYGSRARNSHNEKSDFDIAVICDQNPGAWAQLHWELEEGLLTLFPVDLIDFNSASKELKEQIEKEGTILYEQD